MIELQEKLFLAEKERDEAKMQVKLMQESLGKIKDATNYILVPVMTRGLQNLLDVIDREFLLKVGEKDE